MKAIERRLIIFLVTFALVLVSVPALAGPHDLVVVRPGGPSASEQALAQIDRLAKQLAEKAGWDKTTAKGSYFTDEAEGLKYIKANKPGFILGSMGFYLKYRDELGLTIINQAILAGSLESKYYVVSKKGGPASLADLKGKTFAGTHLEEPEFVERILLERALAFDKDVTIKTMRSLRALKKLAKGEVDAVILDQKEYDGIAQLPFAGDLQTIFTSKPVPNNGFMSVKGNATAADKAAFLKSATNFCSYEDAKGICEDFDIQGFKPAKDGSFSGLRNLYKGK